MPFKNKKDKTPTRKVMFSSGNEGSFPSSSFGITKEFLVSYLYGKNNIKTVDRKQLVEETAAKRGLQESSYRQHKIDAALPYAFTTFPNEVQLCQSSIPGSSYGVCTKNCIPRDTWIGPYEGRQIALNDVTPDMDTSFFWEIYENGKLAYYINGSDVNSSSWMRFIRCARHEQEQNLCAIQYKGNIFYRVFRDIPPGEEMLVWYDKNYSQHMGIPIGLHDKFFINISDSRQQQKQFLDKDTPKMIPQQRVQQALNPSSSGQAIQLPVEVNKPQHNDSEELKSGSRICFEDVSSTFPGHHLSECFQPVKANIISGQRTSDQVRKDGTFQRISRTSMPEEDQSPHSTTSNLVGLNRGVKRKNLPYQDKTSLDDSHGNSATNSSLQGIGFSRNKAPRQNYSEGINVSKRHYGNWNVDFCNSSNPKASGPIIDLYSPSNSVSSLNSNSYDLNTPVGSPLADVYKSRKQEVSPALSRYSRDRLRFNFEEVPISPTEIYSPTKPLVSPDLPVAAQPNNSPVKPLASPDLPLTAQSRYSPVKPQGNPDLPATAQSRYSPVKPLASPDLPMTAQSQFSPGKPLASPDLTVTASPDLPMTPQSRHSPVKPPATSDLPVTAQSRNSPVKRQASPDLPVTPQSRYSPTDEIHEWKCGQCHKTFTQRVLLQNHVCPRQPDKPYKCGHCAEKFANTSDLRIHVVKHTSEKPFKCGFCSRAFAGATTLNNHIRTHTGEKPFGCEKCGSSFSQASQLARHLRLPGECVADTTTSTDASAKNRKLSVEL